MEIDISRIQSAFSPAEEIRDPHLFVGRSDAIRDGMLALTNPGSFLVIHGVRGVGKSSIAHQLRLIAEGSDELPKMLYLQKFLPKRGFSFLTQYIRCDSTTKTIHDLIKRIIFGESSDASLFDLTKAGDRRLDGIKKVMSAEGGANFGIKIGTKGTEEKTFSTYVSDDFMQQFKQLLGTIHKDNQKRTGLLIIIDEFDTFAEKQEFASLVKTASSDFVKFAVVGIANSVTELIEGHSSIGRRIETVEVDKMPENELWGILSRAEYRVDKQLHFDDESAKLITSQAEGFPYFVHLLGRESFVIAFERDMSKITKPIIDELTQRITTGRLGTIYEDIYHSAVKSSPQREILLKLFAEQNEDEIGAERVYKTAKEFDISNPSQLMKELTAPHHGVPILVKVRDRFYRFSDPVFKTYAKIRNWKFETT